MKNKFKLDAVSKMVLFIDPPRISFWASPSSSCLKWIKNRLRLECKVITTRALSVILPSLLCFCWSMGKASVTFKRSEKHLESQIWGKWRYIGFIYRGKFQTPNSNLILTFEFFEDGSDTLRWNYVDEEGFCERKGEYSYNGVHLKDKIVWVNPKNSVSCQKDPDMMLGRVQITPLQRVEDQIHLEIPLSDETLIYILRAEKSSQKNKIKLRYDNQDTIELESRIKRRQGK